jgi:hypothetical protein
MPVRRIASHLSPHGTVGIEWEVRSGDLRIGSIYKGFLNLSRRRKTLWAWHLAWQVAPPGFEMHGFAGTVESALEAVER